MNCVNIRGPSDNSGMLQRPKPFGGGGALVPPPM